MSISSTAYLSPELLLYLVRLNALQQEALLLLLKAFFPLPDEGENEEVLRMQAFIEELPEQRRAAELHDEERITSLFTEDDIEA